MRTRVLGFPVGEECGVRNCNEYFAHSHGEPEGQSWRDELNTSCAKVEEFLCRIEASPILKDAVKLTLSAASRVLVCLPPDSKKTAIIAASCIRISMSTVSNAIIYVVG